MISKIFISFIEIFYNMDGLKHNIHNQNNLDEYSLFGIGEASVCFEKATSRLKILIIIK